MELLAQRARYAQWLEELAARTSGAPAHVVAKVRADYEARLAAVRGALGSRVAELEGQRRAAIEARDAARAAEQALADARTEAELRHAVGEYDGDEWVALAAESDAALATAAADRLAAEGIEVAVVDLRTLNPLDIEPAAALVRGCGRAAVVTEACLTAGPAAEIGMRLVETCFDWLEEPVIRIAGEDVPIPVAPALEAASIPTADLIVDTMRRLVRRR